MMTKGLCRPGLLTPKPLLQTTHHGADFSYKKSTQSVLTRARCSPGLLGTHRGAARRAPAEVTESSPCSSTSSVGPHTASPTLQMRKPTREVRGRTHGHTAREGKGQGPNPARQSSSDSSSTGRQTEPPWPAAHALGRAGPRQSLSNQRAFAKPFLCSWHRVKTGDKEEARMEAAAPSAPPPVLRPRDPRFTCSLGLLTVPPTLSQVLPLASDERPGRGEHPLRARLGASLGSTAWGPVPCITWSHPMPAGTWGVVPKAGESWQLSFRLAEPLPRVSQVWAPGLALASSGSRGGTGSPGARPPGWPRGQGGPGFREEPSPGHGGTRLPPDLGLPITSPRNPSEALSWAAGGSARGQLGPALLQR